MSQSEGQLRISRPSTFGTVGTKEVEDRTARKGEKRKTTETIQGCDEGGHAEGWGDRGGCCRGFTVVISKGSSQEKKSKNV